MRQITDVNSSIGWDDLGDFSSLADLLPAEKNHPVILGDPNLGTPSRRSSIPPPAECSHVL